MPNVKDTLKTSLSKESRVPVHFFKIMGCILSGPGDLQGFNSLKILLTDRYLSPLTRHYLVHPSQDLPFTVPTL